MKSAAKIILISWLTWMGLSLFMLNPIFTLLIVFLCLLVFLDT